MMKVRKARAKRPGFVRCGVAYSEPARFAALARRDLCRAAVRLWTMPLDAALSSARLASRARVWATSPSPSTMAVETFLDAVFSEVRTALLRWRRFSFCLFRLIWDLMFAMGDRVYQRGSDRPARTIGAP